MSKIVEINDEIKFDDGTVISYDHDRDCCEYNYADFKQLDDIGRNTDFDTSNLIFEEFDYGFRFGNEGKMFYIPCYSIQNGYYSRCVDILLNYERVLRAEGEWESGF